MHITGCIQCLGQPIANIVRQAKIAWVDQHEQFILPMTVLEYALLGVSPNLLWYQKVSQTNINHAKQLLAQFELTQLINKRIGNLSGGEKQRLAIVRALMQNTQILLLDEPSNHLDIKHGRQLFAYIKALVCNHQKSIIAVVHHLNHAYQYADMIIALHQGTIFAMGEPCAVMTDANLCQLYDAPIRRYQADHHTVFL